MKILHKWTALAVLAAASAGAQQKEEEPAWAKGRPGSEQAMKMAPVPAFPIQTAAADLPLAKFRLPPGFKAEVWASGILDARGLRQGTKGTVFVSSLFVAGKIYAVTDKDGVRQVRTIADNLMLPNGIEFHKGALYVGTPKAITRYDDIEDHLDRVPAPVTVYDKLPGDATHGWKYMRVGPDGKLYLPVGAPCNICLPDEAHAKILRMNLDGSGVETVARGVRNTVGFDFHPKTGELWFTDNQRDWVSEDLPHDELNRISRTGQHFGFPYCHQGDFTDPEYGWGKSCDDYVKPAALLGAHVAPLGMTFYTGKMFPKKYQGAIFIARHGSWNRTSKQGADVIVAFPDGKGGARTEPFLTGLLENNELLGRPADVMVMHDGSLLVSDDHNGAIYRISYGAR
ncbi:MAG: PQQ-dependent sugar dehydrogenase [Pseudomonadota bacterium]